MVITLATLHWPAQVHARKDISLLQTLSSEEILMCQRYHVKFFSHTTRVYEAMWTVSRSADLQQSPWGQRGFIDFFSVGQYGICQERVAAVWSSSCVGV